MVIEDVINQLNDIGFMDEHLDMDGSAKMYYHLYDDGSLSICINDMDTYIVMCENERLMIWNTTDRGDFIGWKWCDACTDDISTLLVLYK